MIEFFFASFKIYRPLFVIFSVGLLTLPSVFDIIQQVDLKIGSDRRNARDSIRFNLYTGDKNHASDVRCKRQTEDQIGRAHV